MFSYQTLMRLLSSVRRLPLRTVAVLALGLLVVVSFFRGCRPPVDTPQKPLNEETLDTPQKPLNEETLLEVNVSPNRLISARTPDARVVKYVPQDGAATVSVQKDGSVDLKVKSGGVSFKPGLSMIVTDRLRVGLDVQVAYWNRLEAHAGLAGPRIVGYVGLGYRLDAIGLNNTSAQVVLTTDKRIGGALSVRF
jgi:hypothetical protein